MPIDWTQVNQGRFDGTDKLAQLISSGGGGGGASGDSATTRHSAVTIDTPDGPIFGKQNNLTGDIEPVLDKNGKTIPRGYAPGETAGIYTSTQGRLGLGRQQAKTAGIDLGGSEEQPPHPGIQSLLKQPEPSPQQLPAENAPLAPTQQPIPTPAQMAPQPGPVRQSERPPTNIIPGTWPKILGDVETEYNKISPDYAKTRAAKSALGSAWDMSILAQDNSNAAGALGAMMSEVYEPSGVKTDKDVTRYMTERGWGNQFQNWVNTGFTGRVRPEMADALREAIAIRNRNIDKELGRHTSNIVRRASSLGIAPDYAAAHFSDTLGGIPKGSAEESSAIKKVTAPRSPGGGLGGTIKRSLQSLGIGSNPTSRPSPLSPEKEAPQGQESPEQELARLKAKHGRK